MERMVITTFIFRELIRVTLFWFKWSLKRCHSLKTSQNALEEKVNSIGRFLLLDLRNLHFTTEWKNLRVEISIILPCCLVLSFRNSFVCDLFFDHFRFFLFPPFPPFLPLYYCPQETSCSGWMERAIWNLMTSRTRTMTSSPRRKPLETLRVAWVQRKSLCSPLFVSVVWQTGRLQVKQSFVLVVI